MDKSQKHNAEQRKQITKHNGEEMNIANVYQRGIDKLCYTL